jgi:thiamine biosynthesis lipoprotein
MQQQRGIKRRDFLRIVGASSVAGLGALILGRDDNRANTPEIVTETRLLMGTVVNLTLVTSDRNAGQTAIDACLTQMSSLETVLSRHQPDSQLSRLNRDGFLALADPHLVHVLREAQHIAALTDGAFDVTVKPLVDLYQNSLNAGNGLPQIESLASTLGHVGYHHLEIGDNTVSFTQAGMSVTLDGIAKGYIVDEGVSILRQSGFDNVLVEAGGDLSASGTKAQGSPWRIGIQSPRNDGARLLNKFTITNQAAATSGDYMQPYTDNLTLHHILDPKTGFSAPQLASATVIAPSGMEADALATALMVMEPGRGLALIESLAACEAYLITKDLTIWHSSGFVTT